VTLPVVTLFSRPNCHLCDEARAVLEAVCASHPFVLHERDIEADDATFKAYLERIPVVALDGRELYEFSVDAGDLRARLAGAGP